MNPRTIIFTNVDERHECNARMNPSASNGKKFVRVVPSNNADADPSSSCVRDYSCLSSMTAGKRKLIGIRSSRLVLPRTSLPRTSSNPGQNQNSSSNPGQNKTPVRILVKMKTPAPILVSLPRMATHNVPERASSQISK